MLGANHQEERNVRKTDAPPIRGVGNVHREQKQTFVLGLGAPCH